MKTSIIILSICCCIIIGIIIGTGTFLYFNQDYLPSSMKSNTESPEATETTENQENNDKAEGPESDNITDGNDIKAETKSIPKAETKSIPKAETKSIPKAETKSIPKAETKPTPTINTPPKKEEEKPMCSNANDCGEKQFCDRGKCVDWIKKDPPFCKKEQDCNDQKSPIKNAYWTCDIETGNAGLFSCKANIGCRNDTDCPGEKCLDINGIKKCGMCKNSSECGDKEFCDINNKCTKWASLNPPFCKTEKDCNDQSPTAYNSYWTCEDKTEFEGLKRCRPNIGCRNDADCPGEKCLDINGIKKCGTCRTATECPDGQFCNANNKCAPWVPQSPPFCKTEQDCNRQAPPTRNAYWTCDTPSEFAGLNKCTPRIGCRNDGDCPGERCLNINGVMKCGTCTTASECPDGQYCDSTDKCAPWVPQSPPFCKNEQDCNRQSPPERNSYWICDTPTPFKGLNKCTPRIGCRNDGDCPGEKCLNINGVMRCGNCSTASDCPPGQFCTGDGKCSPWSPASPPFCKNEQDCGTAVHNAYWTCSDGTQFPGLQRCKANIGCRNDGDCKQGGTRCLGGTCKQCNTTGDCSDPNQWCNGGTCMNYVQGYCRSNAQCPSGQECVNFGAQFEGLGTCVPKPVPKNLIAGTWRNSLGIVININSDINGTLSGTFNNFPMVGYWMANNVWKLGTARGTVDAILNGEILSVTNFGVFNRISGGQTSSLESNVDIRCCDIPGGQLSNISSADECVNQCRNTAGCSAITYVTDSFSVPHVRRMCFLKTSPNDASFVRDYTASGLVSGRI
jgi:hypothetical protein